MIVVTANNINDLYYVANTIGEQLKYPSMSVSKDVSITTGTAITFQPQHGLRQLFLMRSYFDEIGYVLFDATTINKLL